MNRLPRIGDRIRDTRTDDVAEVVGLEGITGSSGGVFLVVKRPGEMNRARVLTYLVPLGLAQKLN